ncbi:TPA: hypothetical protein HA235_04120 [Candidatus Woesearchaeota archaeon]|nr:hypothetical protein [uncultured archaeon]MBS3173040.1 hypothetical protein [Candidatus Woesearchaeota archaeon]AQS32949.1 hypothetical protein [uncultured archaeon]HIH31870.1 hypothetical protein [Candidatus Woesearchaeota archaeon]HIH54379.1 hypothetical protein [Candidatus Woesearchaeota archaeon]
MTWHKESKRSGWKKWVIGGMIIVSGAYLGVKNWICSPAADEQNKPKIEIDSSKQYFPGFNVPVDNLQDSNVVNLPGFEVPVDTIKDTTNQVIIPQIILPKSDSTYVDSSKVDSIVISGDTVSVVKSFKDLTFDQYLKVAKQKGYTGIAELITGRKMTSADYHGIIKDLAAIGGSEIFKEDKAWESKHTRPRYKNNNINDKAFESQIKKVYDALHKDVKSNNKPVSGSAKTSKPAESIENKISEDSSVVKDSSNKSLYSIYMRHRNIENKVIDETTLHQWNDDYTSGLNEVASLYSSAINSGKSHYQALDFAADEASLAAIQNKNDALKAIYEAQSLGNNTIVNRWNSKRVDKTQVIEFIKQYDQGKKSENKKYTQKELTAAIAEHYKQTMSVSTLRNYLRA